MIKKPDYRIVVRDGVYVKEYIKHQEEIKEKTIYFTHKDLLNVAILVIGSLSILAIIVGLR